MTGFDPLVDGVEARAYRVPTPAPEADAPCAGTPRRSSSYPCGPGTPPASATPTPTRHARRSSATRWPRRSRAGRRSTCPPGGRTCSATSATTDGPASATELYVDANGAYSPGQARRVAAHLEQADVRWFEEPVSSDDRAGLAELRGMTTVDIAAGEYGYDLAYFARMIGAHAVDCLQVDVTRCGGYTEWRRIAAANRDVSAHCAPNAAAHVAAATPNMRHLGE